MISEAMKALYAGERERGESLLEPGQETVFEAAAFGRVDRLEELLSEQPELARSWSEDGFTPLHLACFAGGARSTRRPIRSPPSPPNSHSDTACQSCGTSGATSAGTYPAWSVRSSFQRPSAFGSCSLPGSGTSASFRPGAKPGS